LCHVRNAATLALLFLNADTVSGRMREVLVDWLIRSDQLCMKGDLYRTQAGAGI
jgi:hypothetical protein